MFLSSSGHLKFLQFGRLVLLNIPCCHQTNETVHRLCDDAVLRPKGPLLFRLWRLLSKHFCERAVLQIGRNMWLSSADRALLLDQIVPVSFCKNPLNAELQHINHKSNRDNTGSPQKSFLVPLWCFPVCQMGLCLHLSASWVWLLQLSVLRDQDQVEEEDGLSAHWLQVPQSFKCYFWIHLRLYWRVYGAEMAGKQRPERQRDASRDFSFHHLHLKNEKWFCSCRQMEPPSSFLNVIDRTGSRQRHNVDTFCDKTFFWENKWSSWIKWPNGFCFVFVFFTNWANEIT